MQSKPFSSWSCLLLLILGGSLMLSGCLDEERRIELTQYINRIKVQKADPIESLPEVREQEAFTYAVQHLRSPFVAPSPVRQDVRVTKGGGPRPDITRRPEALEKFPLDSLRMVGTLKNQGEMWAVVTDIDGTVHRLTKGNYVGQNHGQIIDVNEKDLKVMEILPDGQGGWREREASMTLLE